MRPTTPLALAILFLLLCVVGCASNNSGKLKGTRWTSEKGTIADKEVKENARELVFDEDGSFTYIVHKETGVQVTTEEHKGKWKLGMGDFVTLTMDEPFNRRKQHVEQITINEEIVPDEKAESEKGTKRTKLIMRDSDGHTLTFIKVTTKNP